MDILITFLFIGGGFAEIPARLQPYEFCDDKAQEYITYIENPDYEEGNGQIWIHGTYKGNKIFARLRAESLLTFCSVGLLEQLFA